MSVLKGSTLKRAPAAGMPTGPATAAPILSPRPISPAPYRPPALADGSASVQRLGVVLLQALVFVLVGRVAEFASLILGISTRIALILSVLGLLATAAVGGFPRALLSRCGFLFTAFSAQLMLATAFSIWHGGSVALLLNTWLKSYLVFFVVAGLLVNLESCRGVLYALGLAAPFISVMSLVFSKDASTTDRFQAIGGTLSNPNDLAFYLLITAPLCLLLAVCSKNKLFRVVGGGGAAVAVLTAIRTGSRMGMLMLIAIFLLIFLRAPGGRKVVLSAAALLIGLVGIAITPSDALLRYRLLFVSPQEWVQLDDGQHLEAARAAGSALARQALFTKSVEVTLHNPLVGVGPGMFGVSLGDDRESVAKGLVWRDTHNSFTQISSECGIPALILYLAAFVFCVKSVYSIYKRSRAARDRSLTEMAFCLLLSLTALFVGDLFGNYGYDLAFPLLAGLITVFRRVAVPQIDLSRTASSTTIPA